MCFLLQSFLLADEPIISTFNQEFSAVEGSSVNLPCDVTGDPKPAIIWYKSGIELISDEILEIENDGSLTIKKVKESDEGEFTCKAVNIIGTSDQVIKLSVKGLYISIYFSLF